MAFHPLRTFQKNRKFWMAAVLLVCMGTFVLCTGMQGDFGHRLMEIFSGRGDSLVSIDGTGYTGRDMEDLRVRRDVANEFMRRATQINIEKISRRIAEAQKQAENPNRAAEVGFMFSLLKDLNTRLERPRFFEGGTKFDELIDFVVWRNQADRLGIKLGIEELRYLIHMDVHGRPIGNILNLALDPMTTSVIQRDVRWAHHQANERTIEEALTDEYRVRIAKLALSEVQLLQYIGANNNPAKLHLDPGEWGLLARKAVTPEQFHAYFEKHRAQMTVALVPIRLDKLPADLVKKLHQPTDQELAAFFKKYEDKRYDPSSEDPGFLYPAQVQVELLTASADSPFYKKAAQGALAAELYWPPPVAGAGDSSLTAAANFMARNVTWELILNRLYEGLRAQPFHRDKYATPSWASPIAPAVIGLRDGKLHEAVAKHKDALLKLKEAGKETADTPKEVKEVADELRQRQRETAALVVGLGNTQTQFAALAAYQVAPYFRHPKEIDAVLAAEAKSRAPAVAAFVGALAADAAFGVPVGLPLAEEPKDKEVPKDKQDPKGKQDPKDKQDPKEKPAGRGAFLPALAVWHAQVADDKDRFVPLTDELRAELRMRLERDIYGQRWLNKNMLAARDELNRVKGERLVFDPVVKKLKDQYGFEHKITSGSRLHNQYDIENAPALEALRKAWAKDFGKINKAEGRVTGMANYLREGDFYKLFFESEAFSLGSLNTFTPQFWPPNLQIKQQAEHLARLEKQLLPRLLFEEAEQPVLFWKRQFNSSRAPKSFDESPEVREAVRKAYLMAEARKLVEKLGTDQEPSPLAKAAAELLEKQRQLLKDKRTEDIFIPVKDLARAYGGEPITLEKVSQLVEQKPETAQAPTTYIEYELPRGTVAYPRPDTVKSLLSLSDLKEPIKLGIAEIDRLNKKLFDDKVGNQVVQVLTNKPRTEYYLAVVVRPPVAELRPFQDTYARATGPFRGGNVLLDLYQREVGAQYLRELMKQMREQFKVEITDAGRREFDREEKK